MINESYWNDLYEIIYLNIKHLQPNVVRLCVLMMVIWSKWQYNMPGCQNQHQDLDPPPDLRSTALKWKCHHFDKTSITGCTESCKITNFSAANNENFVKITTFLFQSMAQWMLALVFGPVTFHWSIFMSMSHAYRQWMHPPELYYCNLTLGYGTRNSVVTWTHWYIYEKMYRHDMDECCSYRCFLKSLISRTSE